MLATLAETQPKQSASSGDGPSREDIVFDKAGELLDKLPANYVEDEVKARIEKLGGLEQPLNIFLFQEIQRLQRVIQRVRDTCTVLRQAIRGEVVLTSELQDTMNDMFDAKVPRSWLFTPGGDEFSWLSPTLGLWFGSLIARHHQNYSWLTESRPNAFWMTGFFNPQGFLTAMKQEVTRQHKADKWALDDVVYHTVVLDFERPEQLRASPKEGVYVHGLSLDGAAWSKAEGSLVESEPKKLFAPIPILHVTAVTKAQKKALRDMYQPAGPYECPCYKYAARTDRYLIFAVNLVTKERRPEHWTLRGTALLCTVDA